jgi:hypothetical protein
MSSPVPCWVEAATTDGKGDGSLQSNLGIAAIVSQLPGFGLTIYIFGSVRRR